MHRVLQFHNHSCETKQVVHLSSVIHAIICRVLRDIFRIYHSRGNLWSQVGIRPRVPKRADRCYKRDLSCTFSILFTLTWVIYLPGCCCSWWRRWRCWCSCCGVSSTNHPSCKSRSQLWRKIGVCNTRSRLRSHLLHLPLRHLRVSYRPASAVTNNNLCLSSTISTDKQIFIWKMKD